MTFSSTFVAIYENPPNRKILSILKVGNQAPLGAFFVSPKWKSLILLAFLTNFQSCSSFLTFRYIKTMLFHTGASIMQSTA